jgi:hypothetical protein
LTTARIEFAYAQARLQTRHGRLPDAAVWQQLEASRSAGHFLAQAQAGPLSRWTEGVDERCDAHRIERQLRLHWRCYADEVAHWLPPRWQSATQWFGTLGELALIDATCRRAEGLGWAQADARLAVLAEPDPLRREQALRALGLAPFAALAPGSRSADTARIWHDEWQRRLPPDHGDARLINRPAELLLPRLLAADGARGTDTTASVRGTLRKLFRRHAASALAVFAHLALVAMDLERLRGGLIVRYLFDRGADTAPQGA